MHLQEGEQSLEDRMSEDDLGNAFALHRRVHGDLQTVKDQSSQSENYFNENNESKTDVFELVQLAYRGHQHASRKMYEVSWREKCELVSGYRTSPVTQSRHRHSSNSRAISSETGTDRSAGICRCT